MESLGNFAVNIQETHIIERHASGQSVQVMRETIPAESVRMGSHEFHAVYCSNAERIHAFILSILPNRADADDILQETSLLLWQKFDQFESGTDFVAWACQFAKYRVMKLQEKRRRSRITFNAEVQESIAKEFSQMKRTLDDRQHALEECLNALSAKDFQLLRIRYVDGLSPKQMADSTRRTVHAIYKSLNRIHHTLMECIQRKLN